MSSSQPSSALPGAGPERQPAPPESPEQLAARVERLLPLIRFSPGTRLLSANPWRFGLALFPEGPVVFRTRRERFIPEAAWEPGGRAALLAARGIRARFVSTWAEIDEVRAVQTNWNSVRFTFRAGTRTKVTHHELTECGHIFDALAVLLGPRFQSEVARERLSRRWVPSRLGPSILVALVAAVGLLWLGARGVLTQDQTVRSLGFAALVLGFACAARVEAEWGRWLTRRLRSRRPAGVPPYRSRKLGFALRLFGLGLLATVQFAPWNAIIAYAGTNPVFEFFKEPNYAVLMVLVVTALKALDVGHRLALKSSEGVLKDDARAPVVFLRSFEDDGSRNLNPDSQAARWLGLRGWFETGRGIVASLLNVYPLRLLRLAFGTSADTAEEQIARRLRKTLGPVVAIGRPGERVAQAGAARMYVTHDEWQQRVLDMLARCQAVVLQPSETRGVWWEVDQCIQRLERRQILLSLVSFIGSAQAYEAFRLKWEDRTGTPLPRRRGDAVFWRFGEDWTPIPVALSESSPWSWPFTGNGIDWSRTLGPFEAGLRIATPSIPPQPPRRTRRAAPAAVSWALVGIVSGSAQALLLDPWLEARLIASRSGSEWSQDLSRLFNNWHPRGHWTTVSSPRPGFQWEVQSNGGRYAAALACVPLAAEGSTSGLRDFFACYPGEAIVGGDALTWNKYAIDEGASQTIEANPRSAFVHVEAGSAWILELTRPSESRFLPSAVTAAILDSLLDMQAIRPLQPDKPANKPSVSRPGALPPLQGPSRPLFPERLLPPLWWAHYLAQCPPDPGRNLTVAAGHEWSLALDRAYWGQLVGLGTILSWKSLDGELRLELWSEEPSSDLEEIVDEVLQSQSGVVQQDCATGITGDPASSRNLTFVSQDERGRSATTFVLLIRTRSSVHFVSLDGPTSAWQTQLPAARRALAGFLLLAEPYRP